VARTISIGAYSSIKAGTLQQGYHSTADAAGICIDHQGTSVANRGVFSEPAIREGPGIHRMIHQCTASLNVGIVLPMSLIVLRYIRLPFFLTHYRLYDNLQQGPYVA